MSLQDLWHRAHPNSSLRRKYPTVESLPSTYDRHDEDLRAERELGDWFSSEILVTGSEQDWDDSMGWNDRESTDQPGEIDDFLGQGGWHIAYTERQRQGVAGELWPAVDSEVQNDGWIKADDLIDRWARNDRERAFLLALASGHSQGEARRLSGLLRPDPLLSRIRISGYNPPKDEE